MVDEEHIKDRGGAPFQEECNTACFFTGGGRGAILDEIIEALSGHVQIITLIGAEGSGKTMLCEMLHKELGIGTSFKIIFLSKIVESFEDIVRVAAQECDFDYPAETNRADARKIFLNLVATLRERGESVLLIVDEAENMYLATLERIRKILDDVNQGGGGLQLLFSGRKSLNANLEQLALCDFEEVREKQFVLSPLSDNDTWEYLNFCAQDLSVDAPQEVFAKEAASKIVSMGGGNLRMINILAEESLASFSADSSCLVLPDHVHDDGVEREQISASGGIVEQLSSAKKYLFAGFAVFFLFLLIVLFRGGEDQEMVVNDEVASSNDVVVIDLPESFPEETEAVAVKKNSAAVILEKPVETVVEKSVAEVIPDKTIDVSEEKSVKEGVEQPATEALKVATESSEPVPEKTPASRPPVEISPVEIIEKSKSKVKFPILSKQSKISADKIKRIVREPKPEPEPEKTALIKAVPVKPSTFHEPALAGPIAAGEKWLSGQEDARFSIQLMALHSENAEENLKRIIAKPDYKKVLDKLVVLKRPSDPPVVLVFYGLYPSMAAARSARNNMPIFLRDRHPYPVSVRGAVEKARVE